MRAIDLRLYKTKLGKLARMKRRITDDTASLDLIRKFRNPARFDITDSIQ